MPFTAFVCEATQDFVHPEACYQCALNGGLEGCHMTAPIIHGIINNQRPDEWLTATTLLGCPREWRLKVEHDYALRPSSSYWTFRGQLGHALLEAGVEDGEQAITETRFTAFIQVRDLPEELNPHVVVKEDTVLLTGQPDLIYLDRNHLVDYKTTKEVPKSWKQYVCPNTGEVLREGEWPAPYWNRSKAGRYQFDCGCGEQHYPKDIIVESEPRPKADHPKQLSIYALIVYESGIEIDTAEVVYLDMSRPLRISVDLLTYDQTMAMLQERFPLFLQSDLPDPLPLNDKGKPNWKCKEEYCPVYQQCQSIANGDPVQPVEVLRAFDEAEALAALGF